MLGKMLKAVSMLRKAKNEWLFPEDVEGLPLSEQKSFRWRGYQIHGA